MVNKILKKDYAQGKRTNNVAVQNNSCAQFRILYIVHRKEEHVCARKSTKEINENNTKLKNISYEMRLRECGSITTGTRR